MRNSNGKIHFFIPFLLMCLLVIYILATESGVFSKWMGQEFSPAMEQIITDDNSVLVTNEVVKIFLTIQPSIGMTGESFLDRLVVDEKRKEVPIFFQDEEDFLKQKIHSNAEENGSIQVRRRSLNEPSYSYKLRFYDKAGLFWGQQSLNLEKNIEDPLRIRNKLGMDLLRELDILVPLNCRFSQVFIKDANVSLANDYLDYGLFFLEEQIDKNFLTIHQLDPNGALYEIDNYDLESQDFRRAVNRNMERRGRNADKALEEILEKINSDYPIASVIEEHFDLNNLLDYMAFSILVQKEDPGEERYILYSSLKDDVWYIFPSSFRDAFGNSRDVKWKRGIHVFRENPLFDKIANDNTLREELIIRVQQLHEKMGAVDMEAMIEEYEKVIMPYLSGLPDYQYMEMPIPEFQESLYLLLEMIDSNYVEFIQSLEYPTPIQIKVDGSLIYWDSSTSFVGADTHYTLAVSEYPDFRSVALIKGNITETSYRIDSLKSGDYYVTVTVMDSQGYDQGAVNRYTDPFGKNYHGVKKVVIP